MDMVYSSEIRSDPSITNPDPWYGTGVTEEGKTPDLTNWGRIPLSRLFGGSPTLIALTSLGLRAPIQYGMKMQTLSPNVSETLNKLVGSFTLSRRDATSSDRTDISDLLWEWLGTSHYSVLNVPFEAMTQMAVDKFSSIPQVEAIYRDRVNNRLSFWVFTSNDKYDDALMNILIAKEEEILDAYPQFVTSISFPPSVLCEDHREVVGNTATAIFER